MLKQSKELVKKRISSQIKRKAKSPDMLFNSLKELSYGLIQSDKEWAIKHLTLLGIDKHHIPEIKIKAGDCSGFCMLIATCILEISEADQILLHPEVILCPQISNPIEKNWSFWKRDGNLKFSYGLDPRHEVFDLALDPNDTLRCTGIHQVVQSAFIGQFKQYYRNKIHISVTTPAVPYHGDELYIGVGHVKYNYKDI